MDFQTYINALHALVQMANGDPSLLHGGLCSHGLEHGVKGTPNLKVWNEKSKGNGNSEVTTRKVNSSAKSDEDAVDLESPLSAVLHSAGRKQRKLRKFKKLSSLRPEPMENNVSQKDDNLYEECQLLDCHELTNGWKINGQKPTEACVEDCDDRLLGTLTTKKQKIMAADVSTPVETSSKTQEFKLAAPTVHTGFSFSIIHLLTAVRRAMVVPHAEDDDLLQENVEGESIGDELNESHDVEDNGITKNLPCLTLNKIVERIRSTPMDPCILQTQEPLEDLVRRVLKIFSTKAAPLGASGWKPLTLYHKSSKCWSWIGPITLDSRKTDEEDLSSEGWSLCDNMLVKLVDSFAIWLKSFQERLRQVESLPASPLVFMQPALDANKWLIDVKCRMRTISPSSEEVRAYFQKEESVRYLVPDQAFSYTALDGRKSAVAPLSRWSVKPSSRQRQHFALKADRPPFVTVLCLVRDAAARLPGNIGTKEDILALIRDSQYIVDEVSDEQLVPVVGGALHRLHYEYDPCVRFDRSRRLWLYLHGERGEADFEDDGTLRPKRKKQKMLLSKLSVDETQHQNGQEETC